MSVWNGTAGAVILGPTQHRVAQHLVRATKYGRVTLSSPQLAAELRMGRSDFYRITRQLRILGLFGIENDQGGAKGGRRYWRTARRDGRELPATRHRAAWARVTGWLKARAKALQALGRAIAGAPAGKGPHDPSRQAPPSPPHRQQPLGLPLGPPSGPSVLERLRQAGLRSDLADAWQKKGEPA